MPSNQTFKKYYDGEVTTYYLGKIAISFEHWYEASEGRNPPRLTNDDKKVK